MKRWGEMGLPFITIRSVAEKAHAEGCRGCPRWKLPRLPGNCLLDVAAVKPPRRIDGQPGAPGLTRRNQPHASRDATIPATALIADRGLLTMHAEQRRHPRPARIGRPATRAAARGGPPARP